MRCLFALNIQYQTVPADIKMWLISFKTSTSSDSALSEVIYTVISKSFKFSAAFVGTLKTRKVESSSKFLLITNLTHCFHVFIYFISLHVSSITVLIIRRSNCITTSSGMISLCKWLLGVPARRELHFPPDRHTKQSHRLIIPDEVLIELDLLMMSAVMLETCREMK